VMSFVPMGVGGDCERGAPSWWPAMAFASGNRFFENVASGLIGFFLEDLDQIAGSHQG